MLSSNDIHDKSLWTVTLLLSCSLPDDLKTQAYDYCICVSDYMCVSVHFCVSCLCLQGGCVLLSVELGWCSHMRFKKSTLSLLVTNCAIKIKLPWLLLYMWRFKAGVCHSAWLQSSSYSLHLSHSSTLKCALKPTLCIERFVGAFISNAFLKIYSISHTHDTKTWYTHSSNLRPSHHEYKETHTDCGKTSMIYTFLKGHFFCLHDGKVLRGC